MNSHLLLDGGYVSFLAGFTPVTYNKFISQQPYKDCMWIMDGFENYREEQYPEYKANRKDMTDDQKSIRERVTHIRNLVLKRYPKVAFNNNLEGDDLIALMHYAFEKTDFVTVASDKDMLQIPTINMYGSAKNSNGVQHRELEATAQKQATLTVGPYLYTPLRWLLYQAVMGDKVDNIPTILPKKENGVHYDYDILFDLFLSKKPFTFAYQLMGKAFANNLYLVILPYPKILGDYPVEYILEALDQAYYEPNYNWVKLIGIYDDLQRYLDNIYRQSEIKEMPVVEITGKHAWLNDVSGGTGIHFNFVEEAIELHSKRKSN